MNTDNNNNDLLEWGTVQSEGPTRTITHLDKSEGLLITTKNNLVLLYMFLQLVYIF